MRALFNNFDNSSRSRAAGVWGVLFFVLVFCLCATVASAQTVPPIVMSQLTWLNTLQTGGAISSGDPAGASFVVNQNGDIILGNTKALWLFNGQTGAATNLGTVSNVQAVAVDSKNNLYVANLYNPPIVKVPFVNGAYVAYNSAPAGNCTGNDAVACKVPGLTVSANGYWFGVASMAFDASGDFFFATINQNTAPNSIWECSAACMTGTGSVVQIYQEPTTVPTPTATSGTGQLILGGLAIDPWGNIFFTDSSIYITATYGIESFSSYVKEIPTSGGAGYGGLTTGYAAVPTTLYTETIAAPAAYDDELDGVAIDSNGTVYVADQYNGIFAFPNSGSAIPMTSGQPTYMYVVSPQGGKTLAIDGKGNLYVASYSTESGSGTDSLARISVGNITGPAEVVGVQGSMTNISAAVNDGAATPVLTFVASSGGQAIPSSNISATPGTVASLFNGKVFPVTLLYKLGNVGLQSAVLTATDTATSDTGAASIYAVGNGPMVTLDPGTKTSYTTGFVYPSWVSVDSHGDLAVPDGGGGDVLVLPSGSSTWTSIAGFVNPQSTAFDANANLYVADATSNIIYKIPNTNTTGGFTAGATTTLLAATAKFGGTALNEPQGLMVGPDGVLYISDLSNNRVVTYNLNSGVTAVRVSTGLSNPVGMAVDASGNLYVANENPAVASVVKYSGGGVTTTLSAIPGVATPWGIAVDASGSVLVADNANGKIVRIPNEAGVLNVADAIAIEANPISASGVAIDGAGDIYVTDTQQQAVYAIQRTSASLTFPTVTDGNTSAAEILYVEAAGNMPITAGNPFATGLTGPFTEAVGAPTPCTDGGSGPVGYSCELSVTFAPTGAESGAQTGSFTLNSNSLTAPTAPVTLHGTAQPALTAQTITFTAPVITSYTFPVAAPITVSATSTSTLAVTLTLDASSTGTGTFIGGVLTVTGAGTFVIDANQAGNATYAPATEVKLTITVGLAAQTISFTAPAITTYTYPVAAPITVAATATSTLPVTLALDASSTGAGTFVGGVLTVTGAGTFVIDANQAGNGSYAPAPQVKLTITVNKATQTSSFTAPTTTTYTYPVAAPITVMATSTSTLTTALTLDASSTGAGTFVGGVLTVTGAGTFVIDANQAGNANYSAAPQVQLTITVNKGTQTISFTAPTTTTYAFPVAAPITVTATSTSTLTTALTLDASSTGAGTFIGGVLTVTGTGTFVIDANQVGNANYSAAPQVQLTITVNKGTQTISFTAPTTTTYTFPVAAPITVTATSTSTLSAALTLDASSTGTGTFIGGVLTVTGTGTFVIDANQVGNANYSAAPQVQLTITVNKGTQTITITGGLTQSIPYSATPITLSAASSGASGNPVTFTVFTGMGLTSGTNGATLTMQGVGPIVINAQQAANANYNAGFTQFTINVTALGTVITPVITPASTTLYLGEANITLASTSGANLYYTLVSGAVGTTPSASSTLYTAAGIPVPTTIGTYTLEAIGIETGYTTSGIATVTFTVSAIPPSFTMTAGPSALAITAPGVGSTTITVTPVGGFASTITFACIGLPNGAQCAFNPASLTLNGTTASTTVVGVAVPTMTVALHRDSKPLFPLATLAVALCLFGIRKRRNLQMLLLLAVSVVGLGLVTGCSHKMFNSEPPPSTTTVTVVATSTSPALQETTTFTLVTQ